jgi:hypothetical protein
MCKPFEGRDVHGMICGRGGAETPDPRPNRNDREGIEMAIEKLQQNFFERHADKMVVGGADECWHWTAAKNGKGYGSVGARGKVRLAHREAYEAIHGENSANGLVVRHRCDVPACVNPAHLELGTVADNNRDMVERGRHGRTAPKGVAHSMAKLTETDVRAIRAEYVRGGSTHNQLGLARRFGVARTVIGRIVNRELWAHIA